MHVLQRIDEYGETLAARDVYVWKEHRMTYGQLKLYSDRIAAWLLDTYPENDRRPVVVYGHKNPMMLAAFIGCAKAGRAYCPVDVSLPGDRLRMIISMTATPAVLATEPLENVEARVVQAGDIAKEYPRSASPESWLSPEQTLYIIFTSGSTGRPKGVEISYGALCNFADWSVTLGGGEEQKQGARFLNQAPFSFDLSVMDLYTCLACGGTLCPLDKETQGNYVRLFSTLKEMDPAVWVSTPSFSEICLADPGFRQELMPSLSAFLFCGERLTNSTAAKLLERFPKAQVINTYGPTESTVAVTGTRITSQLCGLSEPLPVGTAKPGTAIYICGEDGRPVPGGEAGEILITGNTLAKGYFEDPEQTGRAFRDLTLPDGETVRAYHTGDAGYLRGDMLYFNGRMDFQVKFHGYRIELGDIEENLLRIPGIAQACVLPRYKEDKVNSLTGFVSLAGADAEAPDPKQDRQRSLAIREQLRAFLPEYMIPKKLVFMSRLPVTPNGKVDRKALKELAS